VGTGSCSIRIGAIVNRLSREQVNIRILDQLGLLAAQPDLGTSEAVSCLLRRAACHLCPCSSSLLTSKVTESLSGLVVEDDVLADLVEQTLQSMVAYGDLVECDRDGSQQTGQTRTSLYLAAPAFVSRENGLFLLFGLAPDRQLPLPPELLGQIECKSYTRRIRCVKDPNSIRQALLECGLVEVPMDVWLKSPPQCRATKLIEQYELKLDNQGPSGELAELQIINFNLPVRHYRGRWSQLGKQHRGRYVARRKQLYGAPLWCYVEICEGRPTKCLDLPLQTFGWRGCDEAWYLQLALDSDSGEPQQCRISMNRSNHMANLEFFSPLPMWARRRWEALGAPAQNKNCLFAYSLPIDEMEEELRFIKEHLWMRVLRTPTGT